MAIQHCLEVCIFLWRQYDSTVPTSLANIYAAVTGVEASGEQLMKVGERLTNLERCFNIREGLQKSDDSLPDRFTKETLPNGPSKGHVVRIGPMVDEYYELRGWDVESGLPKRANLEALELKEMADELESWVSFPPIDKILPKRGKEKFSSSEGRGRSERAGQNRWSVVNERVIR